MAERFARWDVTVMDITQGPELFSRCSAPVQVVQTNESLETSIKEARLIFKKKKQCLTKLKWSLVWLGEAIDKAILNTSKHIIKSNLNILIGTISIRKYIIYRNYIKLTVIKINLLYSLSMHILFEYITFHLEQLTFLPTRIYRI